MKKFPNKQQQGSQGSNQANSGKKRFKGKNKFRGKGGFFKRRRFDNMPKVDREYLDVFKQFRRIQATIIRYVSPSSEEQLLWKYSSNFLSIKELMGQLIYNTENRSAHIAHIIQDQNGHLPVFELSEQVKSEEFAERSLEILMSRFISAKRSIENLLKDSKNEDWQKTAGFDDQNTYTIGAILQELIEHDEKCLDAIFLNLQRHQVWYKPVEVPDETTTPETNDNSTDDA
ncbi:MAG: DinB family protein [Calditrichaeota bacterium]|nr:DinB family protein [Calditrichota bacterium]